MTLIKGTTLYVTDTSGNTVKVTTSAASTVTKTVATNVKSIRPGQTVVVRGTQQKNGNITAESITIGGTGGGFGGFGGGGGGAWLGGRGRQLRRRHGIRRRKWLSIAFVESPSLSRRSRSRRR